MSQQRPIRVLMGKPGLDGHDVGAKIVSMALRDKGMEIIYTGLHSTIDQIVQIAAQEGVDVIGLSILSGAHVPIAQKLIKKLKEKGMSDVPVVMGGVIPKKDIAVLKQCGIAAVCSFSTPLPQVVETVSKVAGTRKRA
ncbi:MAG: methylmalonyl-CoA mutase [Deltaproteobacteria bacterium RBG_13_53_10]|nr:MAG: methylmalonyl-CoA mutase [Deltaproteobacteria bacterium RBG_13_53_10]